MPDPRKPDPRFPDRPTHPDFIRLSEAVQNHDAMAEQLDVSPIAILGIDEKSFLYFLDNRMGTVAQRLFGSQVVLSKPVVGAIYMDAFALGKRYAEMVAEDAPKEAWPDRGLPSQVRDRLIEIVALASKDEVKTNLELTCRVCGEHLCDIEHDDTLDVLVHTALSHSHEEDDTNE